MYCFKYFCTLQYSFTLLTDTKQKPSKLSLGVSNTTQSNVTTTEKPYIYDIPKHKRLVLVQKPKSLDCFSSISQHDLEIVCQDDFTESCHVLIKYIYL